MPQGNTLFNYFTKSPTPANSAASAKKANSSSKIKKVAEEPKSSSKCNRGSEKSGTANETEADVQQELGDELQPGDLVWAKMEGYPWWPSLVYNHPTRNIHYQTEPTSMIHVQFFDQPPTRGWVSSKYVRRFTGLDSRGAQKGGKFFSSDFNWRRGAREAEKAAQLTNEERLVDLVVCTLPSDEEEDMDVDDVESDISRSDESKENHEAKELHLNESNTEEKAAVKPKGKRGKRRKPQPKKRRRIVVHDSSSNESGDEYKPTNLDDESSSSGTSGVEEVSESDQSSTDELPEKIKKRKRRPGFIAATSAETSPLSPTSNSASKLQTSLNKTPTISKTTKSRLSMFAAPESPAASPGNPETGSFTHLKYEFLKEGKIKDAQGLTPGDPNYDPRTLHIPESFKKTLTPALRQWWEMKAKHFDTILFFKVGKFYELYHMDAVTCVDVLGLTFMRGEHAHCGFPEIAYARYADMLIQKGYRVARIEQTETPQMMEERCKSITQRTPNKFDKVVRREICRISTKGTRTYNFIDGDPTQPQNTYLLAIAEKDDSGVVGGSCKYGVCFVDTSIGKFHIGQFSDDRHCSRLRTLIAHYPPSQVLHEKGSLSEKTDQLLKQNLPAVLRDALFPRTEFWESSKTLKFLAEGNYWSTDENAEESHCPEVATETRWPRVLNHMLSSSDTLGLSASPDYELAIKSLGAITWFLQKCCLEQELLSMRNFEEYRPLDEEAGENSSQEQIADFATGRQHMVLDGVTVRNLDLLQNSMTGGREGTLLERLDHCSTPFGKRLLAQWLCAPLCNPKAIEQRLYAVEDLMNNAAIVDEARDMMSRLPDLERFLMRLHCLGSSGRSKTHPDSRAIFFEDLIYNKRKISDLLSTLNGFQLAMDIISIFEKSKFCSSQLLQQCITFTDEGGKFPNMSPELAFFRKAFNHEKAKSDGVIIPEKGVFRDYDEAVHTIKETLFDLDTYLDKQKKVLGCSTLKYWGTGRNRYQLEVPDSAARRVPDEYDLKSQRKGFKRYWTKEIQRLFTQLQAAEDQRDAGLRDCMRGVFHRFDEHYTKWNSAVQCLAVLDVLCMLAEYSRGGDGVMCRPQFVLPTSDVKPFIKIENGRHPCVSQMLVGGDFIPNHTVIGTVSDFSHSEEEVKGSEDSCVVLVTGPNMGGKSTLMRQVGNIVVLAQLGCYVPAESCALTPVDRIFTRLGATDHIMSGESTFFVELSETSSILQHATRHSLVLLDELGRGTATYDGTAIACAVVQDLSRRVQCRTLFSTHYHTLVEEFSTDSNVSLGHMACMVENENEDDVTQETITFLYKFISGACPKSYGFNAAKLAGIPDEIIKKGHEKAREFEQSAARLKLFRQLFTLDSISLPTLRTMQTLIEA